MVVLSILLMLSGAFALSAQETKQQEYQVQAAYLYNFGRFIQWPGDNAAGQKNTFDICVFGQDTFNRTLETLLAKHTLDDKPVVVREITRTQDVADCRILFIGSLQANHLHEILAGLDQHAVLTVSDLPNFLQSGGMIQFVHQGDTVRFKVNLVSVTGARLMFSSELLKVAVSVQGSRFGD